MTDRNEVANHEKLIEEARAGLAAFDEYWGDGGPVDAAYGRPWELIRRLLAVFEKALGEATVTPTDDERESLARAWDAGHRRGIRWKRGDAPENPYRSEVPEPQGEPYSETPEPSARCPKCGVAVTDQTPSTFYTHHDEACGGPLEEPQGEPSDAQVDAAWAVIGGHRVLRETVRAALRAAMSLREGGVR